MGEFSSAAAAATTNTTTTTATTNTTNTATAAAAVTLKGACWHASTDPSESQAKPTVVEGWRWAELAKAQGGREAEQHK